MWSAVTSIPHSCICLPENYDICYFYDECLVSQTLNILLENDVILWLCAMDLTPAIHPKFLFFSISLISRLSSYFEPLLPLPLPIFHSNMFSWSTLDRMHVSSPIEGARFNSIVVLRRLACCRFLKIPKIAGLSIMIENARQVIPGQGYTNMLHPIEKMKALIRLKSSITLLLLDAASKTRKWSRSLGSSLQLRFCCQQWALMWRLLPQVLSITLLTL